MIIKRIFIAEIFFMPMGFVVGYIFKNYINTDHKNERVDLKDSASNNEGAKEGGIAQENEVAAQSEENVIIEEEGSSNDNSLRKKGNKSSTELVDDILIDATREGTDYSNISLNQKIQSGTVEQQAQINQLKEVSDKSLGKHIIVNKRKILNDPKIMAEAVRTMMNKEE